MAERGRRSSRPSGDDRQAAILSTAEKLLGVRSLDDISIEDLAAGAGISRPSFYFYFSSKDEVLLALLDQVIGQVRHRVAALPRDFDTDPAAAWRRSIGVFVDVFTQHRAVAAAAITARLRNAEVHELWSKSMQTWVGYSTEVILAERARGAAPAGIDAHELAAALNLMNERVLAAAFSGETPGVEQGHVLDVLSGIWIRSIYAQPPVIT
ncbi:TetR/AcrR family transcriptional regulator [Subtercola frigoramans]|uniref:AcrR family transcriptional regulator n=1 Tax=Subtercola frigoramans TaxID=120298 RepID=A0ABS2L2Y4_9MICO|nr:TetR/AcrR family transcriptional regulator [Subtercola frigoramans]MBM7471445.1 AcrR family transcriptional regulator [Subtercola frigoramans]